MFTLSQGGGVYVGNYSELRIYDGEIFENEALEEGRRNLHRWFFAFINDCRNNT